VELRDTKNEIDPKDQLAAFIAKFSPEIADQAHEILEKMRARLPGAIEIVGELRCHASRRGQRC
jgi:hypothetical protein